MALFGPNWMLVAAGTGNLEFAKELIQKGADVNKRLANFTPLFWLCKKVLRYGYWLHYFYKMEPTLRMRNTNKKYFHYIKLHFTDT